jgi:putative Mg2+ transporter-C (MgtC) family protein
MAGTRTNALVAAGASAFVMCAFLVRDPSRSEAQIVSYVVSGVGFLGAGVIFKDAGRRAGIEYRGHHLVLGGHRRYLRTESPAVRADPGRPVLCANIVLRPIAYRLQPAHPTGEEQEVDYALELICRPEDEAHMRALLLQGMSQAL